MTELLVYVSEVRADTARGVLAQGCAATGLSIRMEVLGTGALYQRLSHRPLPPAPDLVWWFGPFAARAAATDGLVQASDIAEASPIGVIGSSAPSQFAELAGAPRLGMPDPERSEAGMSILLATLDHARQVQGDVEQGWAWWQERARAGLVLAEDDAGAGAPSNSGGATHALTLGGGSPLADLAAIPHAVSVSANSRNTDAAKRLLDWLTSQRGMLGGPTLDVDWCTQNYTAARQRWVQTGLSPSLAG